MVLYGLTNFDPKLVKASGSVGESQVSLGLINFDPKLVYGHFFSIMILYGTTNFELKLRIARV
jgi:hypothetical protein